MKLLIILSLNTLSPLYITLKKKLELRAKRAFVFPKELIYFFFPCGQLKGRNCISLSVLALREFRARLVARPQYLCRLLHLQVLPYCPIRNCVFIIASQIGNPGIKHSLVNYLNVVVPQSPFNMMTVFWDFSASSKY